MKVYIAGPMRGYAEFNFPAFDAAAAKYRAAGHEVISPADHDREVEASGETVTFRKVIGWDLNVIAAECDGIVMLSGWSASTGARLEHDTAIACGLVIIYEEGAEQTADTLRTRALNLVSNERDRQERLFPGQWQEFARCFTFPVGWDLHRKAAMTAYAILGEEVGEVAHAVLESDTENLLEELVQVSAVATAWVESMLAKQAAVV